MARGFFDRWAALVAYSRVVLSVVALITMLFFALVSREGRLIACGLAIAAGVFLYFALRTLRRSRGAEGKRQA